jgi:hypothetical protein
VILCGHGSSLSSWGPRHSPWERAAHSAGSASTPQPPPSPEHGYLPMWNPAQAAVWTCQAMTRWKFCGPPFREAVRVALGCDSGCDPAPMLPPRHRRWCVAYYYRCCYYRCHWRCCCSCCLSCCPVEASGEPEWLDWWWAYSPYWADCG